MTRSDGKDELTTVSGSFEASISAEASLSHPKQIPAGLDFPSEQKTIRVSAENMPGVILVAIDAIRMAERLQIRQRNAPSAASNSTE